MVKRKYDDMTSRGVAKVLNRLVKGEQFILVERLLLMALKRVFKHEASKVVHPKGSTEQKLLSVAATFAAMMVVDGIIKPEEGVDYVIARYNRDRKGEIPPEFYQDKKQEFLVSEVAKLIGKTSRTVQLHIKAKELDQKHPHAKIQRDDLKKFLKRRYYKLWRDFEMRERQQQSGINRPDLIPK